VGCLPGSKSPSSISPSFLTISLSLFPSKSLYPSSIVHLLLSSQSTLSWVRARAPACPLFHIQGHTLRAPPLTLCLLPALCYRSSLPHYHLCYLCAASAFRLRSLRPARMESLSMWPQSVRVPSSAVSISVITVSDRVRYSRAGHSRAKQGRARHGHSRARHSRAALSTLPRCIRLPRDSSLRALSKQTRPLHTLDCCLPAPFCPQHLAVCQC
jgi:hypothetical protein